MSADRPSEGPPRGLRPAGRWRRSRKAAVAAACVVLATACATSANNSSAGTGAGNSTITIVTPDTSIVWAIDNGFGGYEQGKNLQATLLRKPYIDSAQGRGVQQQDVYKYTPYLASSYDVSADGLVYTFHLSDAKSAAGNTLTADDVLWTFQRKFNTATSVIPGVMSPSLTDPAKQIKKIDDKTVSITLPARGSERRSSPWCPTSAARSTTARCSSSTSHPPTRTR